MKLIVTADDYALSDAITEGICKCARDGVLTQTGLMTNLPGAKYAAERMTREYPHICLGEDINLVAGDPVTDPKLIPTLVQDNGSFKTSWMHRELDKTQPNHISYDEAYLETENQVKRYIELVGHNPEYLSGHSYETTETIKAMRDVAEKYEIVLSMDFYKKLGVGSGPETSPWNKVELPKKFDQNEQLNKNPTQDFLDGKLTYLADALKNNGIAHIHTHAGYVDEDMMRRSSFTFIRMKEANFLCSKELVGWVRDNNVELVSIRDLK